MHRLRRNDVDAPLIELFTGALLDGEATLAAIEVASNDALHDARRLVHGARKRGRLADDRLNRMKALFRDGKLDVEEWRTEGDEITAEREGAVAELAQLTARLEEAEQEHSVVDAQKRLFDLLEELSKLAQRYDPEAEPSLTRSASPWHLSLAESCCIPPMRT